MLFSSAVATAEDRHAARVGGEEQRRLPRRVARADDVDVEAVGVRRLAARRAVGDALPGEPVEPLDRELPPRDAAGEDDRPRAEDVAAVEVHLPRRGVDPLDRAASRGSRRRAGAPAAARGSRARRPTRPTGSRGSSRSGRRCRPGRPGASRSTTIVRRPSDAPYTAAARPAGPAPTITVSYSAAAGSVPRPSSSATRRSCGRTTVLPSTTRIAGRSPSAGSGPPHAARRRPARRA